MKCSKCGAEIPEESSFCPACGAAIEAAPPDPEPTPPAETPPPPPPPPPVQATPTPPPPPAQPTAQPTAQMPVIPAPAPGSTAPYARAPLGGRFVALVVDSIIASALIPLGAMLLWSAMLAERIPVVGALVMGIGGLWYLGYSFGRDAAGGAGFGKRLTGLVVVSAETGAVAKAGPAIVRQVVLWALGLIPAVGSLIEPIMVLVDKDGRRIGDKAAKTQVARASDVAARGIPVATAKGAAIAVLIVALLISAIGVVVGGFVFARALTSVESWEYQEDSFDWETDEQDPWSGDQDPSADEPMAEPEPTPEPELEPEGPVVTPESATDAVGEMLYALMNNDVNRATTYTSRAFQEQYEWFLYPAGGALYQFEVIETFPDPPLLGVRVAEEWNSGPETVLYFVVEEDGRAKVDSVVHENY